MDRSTENPATVLNGNPDILNDLLRKSKLTEVQARVCVLRFSGGGLTHRAISQVLDVSRQSVTRNLKYARKKYPQLPRLLTSHRQHLTVQRSHISGDLGPFQESGHA